MVRLSPCGHRDVTAAFCPAVPRAMGVEIVGLAPPVEKFTSPEMGRVTPCRLVPGSTGRLFDRDQAVGAHAGTMPLVKRISAPPPGPCARGRSASAPCFDRVHPLEGPAVLTLTLPSKS